MKIPGRIRGLLFEDLKTHLKCFFCFFVTSAVSQEMSAMGGRKQRATLHGVLKILRGGNCSVTLSHVSFSGVHTLY